MESVEKKDKHWTKCPSEESQARYAKDENRTLSRSEQIVLSIELLGIVDSIFRREREKN
jgi:hypothetical protein